MNDDDVAPARSLEVNDITWAPAPFTVRSVNVATPSTAFTDVVPASAPLPIAMLAVTVTLDPGTLLSSASRTSTTGCVGSGWPEIALLGSVAIASLAARIAARSAGLIHVAVPANI